MFDNYAEIFSERAVAYHSAMTRLPRAREAEFQAVLSPLHDVPGGLVCDMPSGGCYLASHLPLGMRYIGIEPVAEFFNAPITARRAALSAEIDNVPLPNASVDYIVSLAGLHHEANLTRVLAEMQRLLRPLGRLVIVDVAVDTPAARFLNGFVARNNPMGHDGCFLDDSTRSSLERAGFTVIDDSMVEVPWTFNSLEEAGSFCGELFGIAGLSPQQIGDALEREIGFHAEGDRVHLRWALRRLVCQAS